jgi:hypothetical protein
MFWEKYETRPLLRAMEGLASTLADLDQSEAGLGYYRQMISLDPDDHCGARYAALHILVDQQNYQDAHQLIHSFPNELSAFWSYTHALISFVSQGSSLKADNMLRWALQQNPHVPEYLTGVKTLPQEYPGSFAAGDENEAVYYAADYYSYWWRVPGAIDWLKTQNT